MEIHGLASSKVIADLEERRVKEKRTLNSLTKIIKLERENRKQGGLPLSQQAGASSSTAESVPLKRRPPADPRKANKRKRDSI
jgi:hypothetical protein